jgi:CBS domain containing-hemolysin-like protein
MLLEGTTSLRDLSTQLDWEFSRQPGVETLAGFVLAELGHLPLVGETVLHGRSRFTVAEMNGRRIATIRIDPLTAAPDRADPTATEDDGLEVSA